MSNSTPKTSRAFTVVSGASMADVGRTSGMFATLLISSRLLCPFDNARGTARPRLPGGRRGGMRRGRGPVLQAPAQQAVGAVDVLELFLGPAVAARQVRVVALRQLLVSRPELRLVDRPGQAEQ